jgi:hypothetical protein
MIVELILIQKPDSSHVLAQLQNEAADFADEEQPNEPRTQMSELNAMSQMGHSRRSDRAPATSGLPRSTDIVRLVRFGPNSRNSMRSAVEGTEFERMLSRWVVQQRHRKAISVGMTSLLICDLGGRRKAARNNLKRSSDLAGLLPSQHVQ